MKGRGKQRRSQIRHKTRAIEEVKHEEIADVEDELLDDQLPGANRPEGQVKLTEKELEEKIVRELRARNPQAPSNFTNFSYRDRVFRKDELVDQMVIHFAHDGNLLHEDSKEAHEQSEFAEFKRTKAEIAIAEATVEEGFPTELDKPTLLRSLRNQFNYSERAAQTFSNPIKERGVTTEPPPTQSYSSTVTQWDIYDSFMTDAEVARVMRVEPPAAKKVEKPKKKRGRATSRKEDPIHSLEMARSMKIMERMVNQVAEADVYDDYKYFLDNEPELPEGTMYPLWYIKSEKTKKIEVTALSWNPRYNDLIAVGYGSYHFLRENAGLICCYSLKNTSFPEFSFTTEKSVMCLDWHPNETAMLAVGLYDGTVCVFDVRAKTSKPIYQSTVRTNKHTDPVWQVKWLKEEPGNSFSFYSVSSDGRVTSWVLMKNKLEPEELMKLKLVIKETEGEEIETIMTGLAGGMCFDFSDLNENLFIVGTEEGRIHKCNKNYSGQYMETYEGHHLAVYAVKWNKFHPKIFMSASADWTVKIWDHTFKRPLMSFDLGIAVGDVDWAPYSSTVFSVVTADKSTHVFDLSVDKHGSICKQESISRSKHTHVSFNPSLPVIATGADSGLVSIIKLSPGLRRGPLVPTDEEREAGLNSVALEVRKLDDVIATIDRTIY